MTREAFCARMLEEAGALGIPLSESAADSLYAYHGLLLEWNGRIDLTAVIRPEDMLRTHYIDSLLALRLGLLEPNARVADMGTGAGFPGLPLQIARLDLRVTLVDALQKRCNFLSLVVNRLALPARVCHLRAEEAGRDAALRDGFDAAVARAVAPLGTLLEYLAPLVRPGGRVICWKGPRVGDEMASGRTACAALGLGELRVEDAGLPGASHVFVIAEKVSPTPSAYPRKTAAMRRAPLGEARA